MTTTTNLGLNTPLNQNQVTALMLSHQALLVFNTICSEELVDSLRNVVVSWKGWNERRCYFSFVVGMGAEVRRKCGNIGSFSFGEWRKFSFIAYANPVFISSWLTICSLASLLLHTSRFQNILIAGSSSFMSKNWKSYINDTHIEHGGKG